MNTIKIYTKPKTNSPRTNSCSTKTICNTKLTSNIQTTYFKISNHIHIKSIVKNIIETHYDCQIDIEKSKIYQNCYNRYIQYKQKYDLEHKNSNNLNQQLSKLSTQLNYQQKLAKHYNQTCDNSKNLLSKFQNEKQELETKLKEQMKQNEQFILTIADIHTEHQTEMLKLQTTLD